MHGDSVILAIGSPPGRSARGIVRISGARTHACLEPHVGGDDRWTRRGLYPVGLTVAGLETRCWLMSMPEPGSYTGEDAVELLLPGNPLLLDRIIDRLVHSALARDIETRRAEAGEFTARAFFSGRLTLPQAEGVAATIAARSDAELRAARWLVSGQLGTRIQAIADEIASVLALVEAGIDFTDQDDVVAIAPAERARRVNAVIVELDDVLERSARSAALEAIPWVVLTGPPNAGKSTLFNALLGRERAVVSSVPGTTRDVLVEPLTIDTDRGQAEVLLVDLAGADDAATALDRQIQDAANQAIGHAELVVACRSAGSEFEFDSAPASADLVVRTKLDLVADGDRGDQGETIGVCALTGKGLRELRQAIAARLSERAVSLAADAMILRPRHAEAIERARDGLATMTMAGADLPDELVASSARAALDALATIAGRISPDDVLGRVFATFCIGK